MAIRHLHYLQVDPELRKRAARSARERMSNLVNMNPFLTQDQMVGVQAQLSQLSDWEQGTMAEGDAPPPEHLMGAPAPSLAFRPVPILPPVETPAPAAFEPESEGDRATPIVDMSHLASLLKKPGQDH